MTPRSSARLTMQESGPQPFLIQPGLRDASNTTSGIARPELLAFAGKVVFSKTNRLRFVGPQATASPQIA